MAELHIREHMVALGASLFARGYSAGSGGNLSVRLDDGTFLTTPTNSCLGRLDAGRLSRIRLDGALVSGDSPTKESAFHLALYRAKPDCGAVVHLHSTYAVALSCLLGLDEQDVIRPFTPYYVMKIAPLPLLPYFKPGSPKLAELLEAKAPTAKCFLLANHGPVVTGKNLEDAVNVAEELEETARLVFLLHQGQGGVRHLSGAEIRELLPIH
ncbi:3-oxo-tetronate 4-phosphate decarboxylase [Oleispirillum naphthae]|uniref:3-oxo-tetronate 4-phosphate decarboxylase n=1 Tax=Oleispirillum naphthae TaxID=2838853 RepID=UPI00308226AE